MSVIIRAHCPTCDGVDLIPEQVRLTISTDPAFDCYTFTCPVCSSVVTKPADLFTASLLAGAGVLTVRADVPAEARETHTGPVINADDVLDFMGGDLSMHELVA